MNKQKKEEMKSAQMESLQVLIAKYSKMEVESEQDVDFELAFAKAIYHCLDNTDHYLTDLEWFKNSSVYTGKQDLAVSV